MKTLGKAIAVASLAAASFNATAVEGLSTTIGAVTDYYFRGVNLGDAGGWASLDYEVGGFFVGVWAIDDGGRGLGAGGNDGLETDFYLGYGAELEGIELGIGYTRYEYTYTGDFEHEINLSAGVAGFGIAIALGIDEDEDINTTAGVSDDEADYTVIELTYGSGPYGIKLGSYDRDSSDNFDSSGGSDGNDEAEYKWLEVSYSAEIGTFDVTATLGQQFDVDDKTLGSAPANEPSSGGNNYLVFDISKSFDI